jgi:hypothetical protein
MFYIYFEINSIKKYMIKNLSPTSTVLQLRQELKRIDSLRPIINCLNLSFPFLFELQDNKTLETYGIKSGSKVTGDKYFKPEHQHILDIQLTSVLSDSIACDNTAEYRAILSCGHAADPNSLTNWVKHLLDSGKTELTCPAVVSTSNRTCGAVWEFSEIVDKCLLTQDELAYFEQAISENSIKNSLTIKQCPECTSYLERVDSLDLKMTCIICKIIYDKEFSFCWQCESEWTGGRSGRNMDVCGSPVCKNNDLDILSMCSYVRLPSCPTIGSIPSIRACPLCGKLAEHNGSGCKNVKCPRCDVSYCFSCLETTDICNKTSTHLKKCILPVAHKQAEIQSSKP